MSTLSRIKLMESTLNPLTVTNKKPNKYTRAQVKQGTNLTERLNIYYKTRMSLSMKENQPPRVGSRSVDYYSNNLIRFKTNRLRCSIITTTKPAYGLAKASSLLSTSVIVSLLILLVGTSFLWPTIIQQVECISLNETTTTNQDHSDSSNEIPKNDSSLLDRLTTSLKLPTTTTTDTTKPPISEKVDDSRIRSEPETTTNPEESEESDSNDDTSSGHDADDAPDCTGISVGQSTEGKNLTDNERFINLQTCLQRKMQNRLKETRRSSMEAFDKLSLSGGCSSSLMSLMLGFGDLKSFAFKFMDASAKIPSGVLYGLLSDFGDFDQCISIKSNPNVDYDQELEEGAFSGKYCLVSLRLNYHVDLEPNSTILEGIIPDSLLWDEMIRNYWISKTPKPFQVGVCVPSRCDLDDLNQLIKLIGENYNMITGIQSCQDREDIRQQHQADLLQRVILLAFATLIALTILGTIVDRYHLDLVSSSKETTKRSSNQSVELEDEEDERSMLELLTCFSISKNWRIFVRKHSERHGESLEKGNWTCLPSSSILVAPRENSSENPSLEPSVSHNQQQADNSLKSSAISDNFEKPSSLDKIPFHLGDSLGIEQHSSSIKRQLTVESRLSQLTIRIQPDIQFWVPKQRISLSHLSGLRLFVIVWITMGQSFLYPSANNYQYYRSIINMNVTRNSVWFTTTNYTLGIDMLLYMTGLVFVYKLAQLKMPNSSYMSHRIEFNTVGVLGLITKKILRFWPTYVSLIAIAIVTPLVSDGPMWPEMVNKRLGESCRRNWWSNLLFVNNFFKEQDICLPSSWFVSVLMQLFVIGSLVIFLVHKFSLRVAMVAISTLLLLSCSFSFAFAYIYNLPAPVIRMDESFVMTIDDNIFMLYTNVFNNMGPFLVGMLGGILLARSSLDSSKKMCDPCNSNDTENADKRASNSGVKKGSRSILMRILVDKFPIHPIFLIITVLVLTSVLHQNYTRFWSATYWALHRIGWALSTGYVIHQCATYKWRLLHDFLSLSSFIPLSRLVFIAYLVFPMLIQMHTGLVRDGLHVTIYNMMNIYVTRLVMAFAGALFIHLLVELPFCSIEEILLNRWLKRIKRKASENNKETNSFHPLLAVAPLVSVQTPSD